MKAKFILKVVPDGQTPDTLHRGCAFATESGHHNPIMCDNARAVMRSLGLPDCVTSRVIYKKAVPKKVKTPA